MFWNHEGRTGMRILTVQCIDLNLILPFSGLHLSHEPSPLRVLSPASPSLVQFLQKLILPDPQLAKGNNNSWLCNLEKGHRKGIKTSPDTWFQTILIMLVMCLSPTCQVIWYFQLLSHSWDSTGKCGLLSPMKAVPLSIPLLCLSQVPLLHLSAFQHFWNGFWAMWSCSQWSCLLIIPLKIHH